MHMLMLSVHSSPSLRFENQKNDIPDPRNYSCLFIIALPWFSARRIPLSTVVGQRLLRQPPHSRLAAMVTLAHVPVLDSGARRPNGELMLFSLAADGSPLTLHFVRSAVQKVRATTKKLSSLRKARSVTRAKRTRWLTTPKTSIYFTHSFIVPPPPLLRLSGKCNMLRRSCDRRIS